MTFRIGEQDIAGEGNDEVSAEDVEIGARIARAARKGGLSAATIASKLGLRASVPTGVKTPYGQPVNAHQQTTTADSWAEMGLGTVTNAVAGPAVLQQQFIERFKTGRMMLEQTAVGNILNSVLIGMKPQGANLAARPVSAYANTSVGALVNYDEGQIGQLFTLNLTTVGAAQTITGMAFGTVIRQF